MIENASNSTHETLLQQRNVERDKNNILLHTDKGNYYISYGNHLRPQKAGDILQTSQAVCFELINGLTGDPAWHVPNLKNKVQHTALVTEMENRRKPLIFTDLTNKKDIRKTLAAECAPFSLELGVAAQILKGINGGEVKFSRRELLKRSLRLAAGAYLALPASNVALEGYASVVPEATGNSRILNQVNSALHPEVDVILTGSRNAVIAHKLARLRDYIDNIPTIGLVIGSGHVGIETFLKQSSEQRLLYIKRNMPIIRHWYEEDSVSRIAVCDFDGKKWNTKENFILRELAELY